MTQNSLTNKIKKSIQPITDFQAPAEFEFLSMSVGQKKIVQLGESIHMTHEQPLSRIGIIRFLAEKKNFDVLAFEGSTLDIWIGMDTFLNSKKTSQDITRFRKTAFFGLWQTKEMDQVLTAALLDSKFEKPIYITSFDIQPGIGFGFRKRNPILELGKSLRSYNRQISNKEILATALSLSKLQGCAGKGFPKNASEVQLAQSALTTIEKWIVKVEPALKKKISNSAHLKALSLFPFSLKKSMELCEAHQKNSDTKNKWAVYQPKRDELSAEVAQQILSEVSFNNRLITWGHHSHVNYNTLNRVGMTLGQALKNKFRSDIFTIGVFARDGSALVGQDEPELKSLRPIQDSEIDTYLSNLSKQSYYFDLSGPDVQKIDLLNRPATIRIEGTAVWKIHLAKDYNAIIYLNSVSAPETDFSAMEFSAIQKK